MIIGAGMSGLAAGIRLAYFGKKVCILEKHYRVGGLNSFYSIGGHKFDVGLHAMTNYVPKGTKATPLPKLLRQLRLKHEDLGLCQQQMSMVSFPGKALRFNNDFNFFVQEVVNGFPAQADNFQKLLKTVFEYDELALDAKPIPAGEIVRSVITDPLLADMIFCPLMYYGNAQQSDMEFGQFVIMFKSIFCEGFARPRAGVRHILDLLVRKYRAHGGQLKLRCGVESMQVANGRVESVLLESGEVLSADRILSSAGYVETMRLLRNDDSVPSGHEVGQLSFTECIFVLDRQPSEIGIDTTIIFFNDSDKFSYRKPDSLIDTSSAVICCPNNFRFETPLPESVIRITNMANFDLWNALSQEEYRSQKDACLKAALEQAIRVVPDFRHCITFADMFTPKTIHRFTGHLNGAVYGSPHKIKDGRTHLDNLFICGTDQGFLGIVGAMLSGISMANLHVLKGS